MNCVDKEPISAAIAWTGRVEKTLIYEMASLVTPRMPEVAMSVNRDRRRLPCLRRVLNMLQNITLMWDLKTIHDSHQ